MVKFGCAANPTGQYNNENGGPPGGVGSIVGLEQSMCVVHSVYV